MGMSYEGAAIYGYMMSSDIYNFDKVEAYCEAFNKKYPTLSFTYCYDEPEDQMRIFIESKDFPDCDDYFALEELQVAHDILISQEDSLKKEFGEDLGKLGVHVFQTWG